MKALPDIFPSPVAPPKKLGHASEAMLHILKVRNSYMYDSFSCTLQYTVFHIFYYLTLVSKQWFVIVIVFLFVFQSVEDPNTFLQTRTLSSPVVTVCETNCILAIGTMPVLIFPKEDISDSVMFIMACYYTFHLTYPKCLATLLSVLQTEVLMDAIHDRDMTYHIKKLWLSGGSSSLSRLVHWSPVPVNAGWAGLFRSHSIRVLEYSTFLCQMFIVIQFTALFAQPSVHSVRSFPWVKTTSE